MSAFLCVPEQNFVRRPCIYTCALIINVQEVLVEKKAVGDYDDCDPRSYAYVNLSLSAFLTATNTIQCYE